MLVRRSVTDDDVFDRLPASHVRHLAYLWAGKAGYMAALQMGNGGGYEGPMGCWEAADAALALTGIEPKRLVDKGRNVIFNPKLFEPLPTHDLDPFAAGTYISALATVAIQLRMLMV